jgi:hypothetical protein
MGKTMEAVKDFVYLGSNQSTNSGEEMEIQRRILQANRMYFSLLPITRSRVIHRQTKNQLYETVIQVKAALSPESQNQLRMHLKGKY